MPLVDPITSPAALSAARQRRGGPSVPKSEASAATATTATATTTGTTTTSAVSLLARQAGPAALLLAGLAWSFDGLVAEPPVVDPTTAEEGHDAGASALALLLLIATVVQVAGAIVGLAPAGSEPAETAATTTTTTTTTFTPGSPPKKRKTRKNAQTPNVIVTSILSLLLTALATPFVHAGLVLAGAPFLDHVRRTFLCAAHLAVLGLFPAVYTRGTDGAAWRALASGDHVGQHVDAAVGGFWGAIAGAWLGAVPIPLDWDRPWQQWPVTVVVGLYVGHAVGRLLGGAAAARR